MQQFRIKKCRKMGVITHLEKKVAVVPGGAMVVVADVDKKA